eukprot:COSAG01_NODE_23793_length_801_cov_4.368946_1_plen_219_part_10
MNLRNIDCGPALQMRWQGAVRRRRRCCSAAGGALRLEVGERFLCRFRAAVLAGICLRAVCFCRKRKWQTRRGPGLRERGAGCWYWSVPVRVPRPFLSASCCVQRGATCVRKGVARGHAILAPLPRCRGCTNRRGTGHGRVGAELIWVSEALHGRVWRRRRRRRRPRQVMAGPKRWRGQRGRGAVARQQQQQQQHELSTDCCCASTLAVSSAAVSSAAWT